MKLLNCLGIEFRELDCFPRIFIIYRINFRKFSLNKGDSFMVCIFNSTTTWDSFTVILFLALNHIKPLAVASSLMSLPTSNLIPYSSFHSNHLHKNTPLYCTQSSKRFTCPLSEANLRVEEDLRQEVKTSR